MGRPGLCEPPCTLGTGGAPATKALEAFKRSSLPVSLVIDERGLMEGPVTLTDVLEALIGEVPDEGGPAETPIVRRADGLLMVDGLLRLKVLKDHLELDALPREEEADYHTVGGMVIGEGPRDHRRRAQTQTRSRIPRGPASEGSLISRRYTPPRTR